MDRRTTIKWVLAAGSAWPMFGRLGAHANSPSTVQGYGTDPDLTVNSQPGMPWPLSLSEPQRQLAAVLSDIIIPADGVSPSASAAGVVDFIDEWVSAPYPRFLRDRGIVLGGFAWLDAESRRRFGKDFTGAESAGQMAICDDICDPARAAAALRDAAQFFTHYRDLTAGAFYTSPIGRKDLNYVGNVPLATFDGPPAALLKSLGLA
jgi:hypothetical protein